MINMMLVIMTILSMFLMSDKLKLGEEGTKHKTLKTVLLFVYSLLAFFVCGVIMYALENSKLWSG